jgi:hypothetical protein
MSLTTVSQVPYGTPISINLNSNNKCIKKEIEYIKKEIQKIDR